MRYTYSLKKRDKPQNTIYTREELTALTTLQLRDVCRREKIVVGATYKLDREYLIGIILKYRGAKLDRYIDTLLPERFQQTLKLFGSYLDTTDANEAIHAPTAISLFRGLDTTVYDNCIVEGKEIDEGCAFLLDDDNQPCGIMNVRKFEGKYYLTCNSELISESVSPGLYKNYSIGFLPASGSRYLHSYYYQTQQIYPTKMKCYVKNILELRITEARGAESVLVIDFGTSNSSAGAYRGKVIDKVKFVNSDGQNQSLSEILPSVVSVEDCSNPQHIVYRFGYEAVKAARKNHFSGQASVFYGIKKWINDYNKIEDVSDNDGNMASVPRKDIIREYLEYIIGVAERQHKCRYTNLHITSPVKQKQQFLIMYQEIMEGYEILLESALDEGVAVLYNIVSEQIISRNFIDGEEYNALIIDCGGGTTDLTSCVYRVCDNNITYKLDMTTTYANGDTNFGGNNLTFRIFQYLKSLFACYYSKKPAMNLDQLLSTTEDIYRYVDDNSVFEQYIRLEAAYDESEGILPTRFAEYRAAYSDDYVKAKSNFHFIWNLAEKIKTDFFSGTELNHTEFHKNGLITSGHNKILAEESWMVYVYKTIKNKQKALTLETSLPEIVITKEEISVLIKADVYGVIKKFIEPLYDCGDLSYVNSIKLTGQTCKVDIFRDALKEFLEGKRIRSTKKERTVHDLKLTCLEGAAKYQNAKRIGLIAPTLINEAPVTPYRLTAHTHTGANVVLIESSEKITKSYGLVSRHIETESVELFLWDADGRSLHNYDLSTCIKGFAATDYVETGETYHNTIFQDDIDNIKDDEMKIFTFAFEDKWGFYVLPIARKNGGLLMGDKKYFPFENDEWELNFFDGSK